jgi:hypothetical protein
MPCPSIYAAGSMRGTPCNTTNTTTGSAVLISCRMSYWLCSSCAIVLFDGRKHAKFLGICRVLECMKRVGRQRICNCMRAGTRRGCLGLPHPLRHPPGRLICMPYGCSTSQEVAGSIPYIVLV